MAHPKGEGDVTGALATLHRGQRNTFILISNLKQSEEGVFYYDSYLLIFNVYSKIENAVKKVTISLTHPFHETCFSLRKV